jgi:hypothetical protein
MYHIKLQKENCKTKFFCENPKETILSKLKRFGIVEIVTEKEKLMVIKTVKGVFFCHIYKLELANVKKIKHHTKNRLFKLMVYNCSSFLRKENHHFLNLFKQKYESKINKMDYDLKRLAETASFFSDNTLYFAYNGQLYQHKWDE